MAKDSLRFLILQAQAINRIGILKLPNSNNDSKFTTVVVFNITTFERLYSLININSQPRLKLTSRIKTVIAKFIELLQAKSIGDLDKLNLFIYYLKIKI